MDNINCEMRCELSHQNPKQGKQHHNMLPQSKTQIFKEEIKLANKPQIDIPLGEPAQHKPGSKIDISLDDDQPPKLQPDPAPGQILQTEMEIVNRHHEEVREQHRRARAAGRVIFICRYV